MITSLLIPLIHVIYNMPTAPAESRGIIRFTHYERPHQALVELMGWSLLSGAPRVLRRMFLFKETDKRLAVNVG
jgi:hypothetical protein